MEELVKKAKEGSKEAFTEIMLNIKQDLYKISRMRLQNDEDIYDVIQETMLIAFKSIKKLKYNEYFKTWIIRILINECNKIYRKKKYDESLISDSIQSGRYITADETERVENKIDIECLYKNLRYEDRMIIMLYYMERYTDKEIGQILNLKENTVKTKRMRAKEKLKTYGREEKLWTV